MRAIVVDRLMEPRDLQYFAVVAEHGNLRRAAETIGISQPALSKTLRRLETRKPSLNSMRKLASSAARAGGAPASARQRWNSDCMSARQALALALRSSSTPAISSTVLTIMQPQSVRRPRCVAAVPTKKFRRATSGVVLLRARSRTSFVRSANSSRHSRYSRRLSSNVA